ncbi:ankyrin repeat domain-containing protein [Pseudobacteriovorax antillogorgiicola]|uniref:Uncharacterized protein n=1 Tax=Pseudobacteriovorax antillogorgiicola TaxID=1513793 RepID=A0A1Y6C465_9BACT|nr:ankyrin repeat domain-containing protein [Pseudobacteriovorax antillogorgiicola]TCS49757.1 hypothetical protein EDD56_1142 [Pseudobacteriovorax antillogorgiicola]SMF42472.1 hypothetical protein SAMN06296036_1131 [Pseudobacteriovorax antillogorgiicola]
MVTRELLLKSALSSLVALSGTACLEENPESRLKAGIDVESYEKISFDTYRVLCRDGITEFRSAREIINNQVCQDGFFLQVSETIFVMDPKGEENNCLIDVFEYPQLFVLPESAQMKLDGSIKVTGADLGYYCQLEEGVILASDISKVRTGSREQGLVTFDTPFDPSKPVIVFEGVATGKFKLLLEYLDLNPSRVDVISEADRRGSLLIQAVKANRWVFAKLLIDRGASITLEDDLGMNALDYGVELGDEAMLALLEGRVNQEVLNEVLFLSINTLRAEEVQYLLTVGANPNTVDSSRRTPLIVAIQKSQLQIIESLVNAGADMMIEGRGGQLLTAAEFAQAVRANTEVINYLSGRES